MASLVITPPGDHTTAKQVVLTELAESVLALDEERAIKAAHAALHEGLDPYQAIEDKPLV